MTMIPIVASADDIDDAIRYGNNHPNSRWYFGKRFEALDAADRIPEDWPETAALTAARMPKLGTGKRFANLKSSLAKRGVDNPGALAGWIGRKKWGGKKMGQLSAHGRAAAAVTAAADDDEQATVETGHGGQPTPGWLRRVRTEIHEAGIDPDYIEATVPGGFASNFDGTDAVTYAEQLIQAYAESIADEFPELLEGVDTDTDEAADDEEPQEQAPATAGEQTFKAADTTGQAEAAAPAAAPVGAGMTASGAHTVNFYGGGMPEQQLREIVQGELRALLAAAPPRIDDEEDLADGGADESTEDAPVAPPADEVPPPPVDAAGPDGGAPVPDLDAQKEQLRAKFGKRGVAASSKPPSPGVLPDTPSSTGDVSTGPVGTPQGGSPTAPGAVKRPRSVRNSAQMRARIKQSQATGV